MPRLRSSEQLLILYFTYVAVTSRLIFSPITEIWKPWTMAAAIAFIIYVLALKDSVIRDVAPVFYTLAAYREMNWFTPATHDHHLERVWIVWDRWLLNDYHLRAAIESLGSLLPSYFELCYALVYVVAPVGIAFLFAHRRRDRMNTFWIAYLAGTLGAYALFPFFPSEPPRTVFPSADFPHIVTDLRQFNLFIVGGYGIHSSVFPSAHVSSAFSAAWGLSAAIPDPSLDWPSDGVLRNFSGNRNHLRPLPLRRRRRSRNGYKLSGDRRSEARFIPSNMRLPQQIHLHVRRPRMHPKIPVTQLPQHPRRTQNTSSPIPAANPHSHPRIDLRPRVQ